MPKIVRASLADMSSLLKCFRRVDAYLLSLGLDMWDHGYPDEEDFAAEREAGRLYVFKDGSRVIGACAISFDVAEAFFPESHSQRKAVALLEDINYQGEDTVILHHFFIDPAYMGKGLGRTFLQAIHANYKGASFLLSVYPPNTNAQAFFTALGYTRYPNEYEFEFGPYSKQIFMAKTFKKEGLCRNIQW